VARLDAKGDSRIARCRRLKRFHMETESGGRTKHRRNPELSVTVWMPCAACNNGWMSTMENDVLSFMPDMVDRGRIVHLTSARQVALARWAIKTAMVYEFVGEREEPKYFLPVELAAFRERRQIPEHVWIWCGRYDGPRPMHAVQRRYPNNRLGGPGIYSLTLSANFLVLQVFAYRSSEGDLARVAGSTKMHYLMQVWPPSEQAVPAMWPPANTIDDYGLTVLDDRFVNALAR
jgi:hypothetical protein